MDVNFDIFFSLSALLHSVFGERKKFFLGKMNVLFDLDY